MSEYYKISKILLDGEDASELYNITAQWSQILNNPFLRTDGIILNPHPAAAAEGKYSLVSGSSKIITGDYAIGLGDGNEIDAGYAIAIGLSNKISGEETIALGKENEIMRDRSFIMGMGNSIDSNLEGGIIIGHQCRISEGSSFSMALCLQNELTNSYASCVCGDGNKIEGSYTDSISTTFLGGSYSTAKGEMTASFGWGDHIQLVSSDLNPTTVAFGSYNQPTYKDANERLIPYLFTLGNGNSSNGAQNAFAIGDNFIQIGNDPAVGKIDINFIKSVKQGIFNTPLVIKEKLTDENPQNQPKTLIKLDGSAGTGRLILYKPDAATTNTTVISPDGINFGFSNADGEMTATTTLTGAGITITGVTINSNTLSVGGFIYDSSQNTLTLENKISENITEQASTTAQIVPEPKIKINSEPITANRLKGFTVSNQGDSLSSWSFTNLQFDGASPNWCIISTSNDKQYGSLIIDLSQLSDYTIWTDSLGRLYQATNVTKDTVNNIITSFTIENGYFAENEQKSTDSKWKSADGKMYSASFY